MRVHELQTDSGHGADAIDIGAAAWALLLCALWGGLSSSVKLGLQYCPRIGLAGVRFGLGLIAIAVWARVTRNSIRLTKSEWRAIAPLAVMFVTQIVAFNIGTDRGSASHAVVLVNTYPLFVALLAHFWIAGDSLDTRKVFGLVSSFAGILALFAEQFQHSAGFALVGDAVALLSGFLLGVVLVMTKLVTRDVSPVKIIAGQYIIGVPLFFLISILFDPPGRWHFDEGAIIPLIYQGVIVSGLCFVGMTILIKRHPASKIAVFSFATPIFGAIISHLLLGDPLTGGLGAAVILVALGTYVANRAPDVTVPVIMD